MQDLTGSFVHVKLRGVRDVTQFRTRSRKSEGGGRLGFFVLSENVFTQLGGAALAKDQAVPSS